MDSAPPAQRHADPPPGQCWCCGSTIHHPDRMVHLSDHPDVALSLPCARWAAKRTWEIEDRDGSGIRVSARGQVRRLRRAVIERNWHRHPVFGASLRRLGKHLP